MKRRHRLFLDVLLILRLVSEVSSDCSTIHLIDRITAQRECYDIYNGCYIDCRICIPKGQWKRGSGDDSCQVCNGNSNFFSDRPDGESCNDNDLCTKDDQCKVGNCVGTAFTCKSCESCAGNGCTINSGHCVIDDMCYTNDEVNPDEQCQACKSSSTSIQWTALTNDDCNDEDDCTYNDKCTSTGICQGTLLNCNLDCQTCQGTSTCKVTGCITSGGTCGCSISRNGVDVCYDNNAVNPDNQCQYCNIRATPTAWTNYATQPCNDGIACTRDDTCNQGTCSGTDFSSECAVHTVSTNPCVQSTKCDRSNCLPVYHDSSEQCYSNQDDCDYPDLFCSGDKATCRYCDGSGSCTDVLNTKKPTTGVDITNALVSVFSTLTPSQLLAPVQGTDGNPYLMLTDRQEIKVRFQGFKVPCDKVTIDWQLVDTANGDAVVYSSTGQISIASDVVHDVTVTSQFTLTNGGTYMIKATTRNVRGTESFKNSDEILVDDTKPTIGAVYDGKQPQANQYLDIDYQSGTGSIAIHWDPNTILDSESGINTDSFRIAVGLTAGGTDIKDYVESASKEITGLSLTHNTKYFATLRVYNRAGLFQTQSSDGVTVDTTAPLTGTLTIVKSASETSQIDYYTSPSRRIVATLLDCSDAESGILKITWTVCATNVNDPNDSACNTDGYQTYTCSDPADCLIDVTFQTSDRILHNGNFQSGYLYTLSLRIQNRALLTSSVDSNSVLADYDEPLGGTVFDGLVSDADYQFVNTSIDARWFGFSDDQSGLDFCQLAVYEEYLESTKRLLSDFRNVPLSGNTTVSNLVLKAETTVYAVVRCFDKAGFYTDVASDGVFIDPYHPTATEILDIRYEDSVNDENVDRDYQVEQGGVKSKWQVFPSASGLASCKWSLSSASDVDSKLGDVVPWQPISPTSTTNTYNIQLTVFVTNYAAVSCTSRAGLSTTVFSDGIAVDNTYPIVGVVYDLCLDMCGLSTDIAYSSNVSALRFRWEGFYDAESGIEYYEWNYDRDCSKSFILSSFVDVGLVDEVVSDQSLDHNVLYCVTVAAVNGAGLKASNSTNGVLIDATPPAKVIVRDGVNPSTDIDYQSSNTTFSFTWPLVTDSESDISRVEVALGAVPNGEDVVPLTDISTTSTSHSFENLSLGQNRVYYAKVCVTNGARVTTCMHSDGVLIDVTPPANGVVIHGTVQPGMTYQANDEQIAAHWYGFKDLESSVKSFEWAIGTSPNLTDILNFTSVGSNVSFEAQLHLVNGGKYFVSVIGYNNGGLQVASVSSGVVVDVTAPSPASVSIRLTWPSVPTGIVASWEDFIDVESDIWYYKWAIGTEQCGTQTQAYVNVGGNTSASTYDVEFASGLSYYASVVARNRAGLSSQSCSDGVLYDNSPPVTGAVRDGDGIVDIDYQSFGDSFSINWDPFVEIHSELDQCSVGIGSTDGGSADIHNFTPVLLEETSHQFSSLSLQHGFKYYGLVRCNNTKGLSATASSDGMTIDLTPPIPGEVRTRAFQVSLDTINVTWTSFTDNESSIEGYSWSISSGRALQQDVLNFTDVKLNTLASAVGLTLKDKETYFVSVRAVNFAGLSSVSSSTGLLIDTSPPLAGRVYDGMDGDDVDFWYSDVGFWSHWSEFVDEESGVVSYRWLIGTNPEGCQVLIATAVAENRTVFCPSCHFIPGVQYFVTVEGTNGAGLKSTASSDGLVVDLTAPDSGTVTSLTWASNDVLTIDWSGASDPDTGISSCLAIAHNSAGWSKRVPLTNFDKQTLQLNASLCCQNDSLLTVYVTCTSNSNLTSTSPSAVTDATPPHAGQVSLAGYDDSSMTLTWNGFYDPESPINRLDVTLRVGNSASRSVTLQPARSIYTFYSDMSLYGTTAAVTAKAVTIIGLESDTVADTFSLDPPSAELSPADCCDVSIQYSMSAIKVSWAWRNDMNNRSIDLGYEYRYSIGTIAGGAQILPYTSVGSQFDAVCSDCALLQGVAYYVNLQVSFDEFSTFFDVQSPAVIIDFTPPTIGKVLDGLNDDVDFFAINDTLEATWSGFTDPESAVKICNISLLDSVSSLVVWTAETESNGTGTVSNSFGSVTIAWFHKVAYFTSVKCMSNSGLFSVAESNGFVVDATPPSGGRVSFSLTRLENGMTYAESDWDNFRDDESGVTSYWWYLSSRNEDHLHEKDVGTASSYSATFNLTSQMEYRVTVQATNRVNLRSRKHSNWFFYDVTPPVSSEVIDGPGATDVDYQLSLVGYSASWGKFVDNETSVVDCLWFVGTEPGGSQVLSPQSVGSQKTSATCEHCVLTPRLTYYSTVLCYNSAWYQTSESSDGVLVDTTLPVSGQVYDGKGKVDLTYQKFASFLDCSWADFSDAESGIAKYQVCVGSSQGICDVRSKTEAADSTEWHFSALVLKHGSTYFCTVYGVNGAGLSSSSSSDGVLVDVTRPVKGTVIDGEQFDSDCQYTDEPIKATWRDFYDVESGIVEYEWAIGTSQGAEDVLPFTSVGLSETASYSINSTASDQRLLVTVRARNGANGMTDAISDGLVMYKREDGLPQGCVAFNDS
ncbi:uncharacterized protein [Oscarella lobularis]|uniref:uncharacterized protein n=1 Tax=Oscarella lobularis TaxID=121494 RepID=UPI00331416FF